MSLRNEIIRAFATASNEKELADTKVILYTSAGMIYGNMVMEGVDLHQTELQENVSSFYAGLLDAVHNKVNSGQLNDCESYIYLTNAVIKPSFGSVARIGNIVVFCDQIVGVSIGTVNNRESDTSFLG